jgi:demethoxyubiquinone hydroxylase (CLK1/Coq7/Cat5 family)
MPTTTPPGVLRPLLQDLYLQDLILALYGVYADHLTDPEGRRLVTMYLRSEEDRRRRIESRLAGSGVRPTPSIRLLFAGAGRLYGRLTSLLGTRVMLRIVLSSSGRAARRACAALGAVSDSELRVLATLRARNEGDLLEPLRQHLIDTRPRRRT